MEILHFPVALSLSLLGEAQGLREREREKRGIFYRREFGSLTAKKLEAVLVVAIVVCTRS